MGLWCGTARAKARAVYHLEAAPAPSVKHLDSTSAAAVHDVDPASASPSIVIIDLVVFEQHSIFVFKQLDLDPLFVELRVIPCQ